MRAEARWALVLATIAFAGCGESAHEKEAKKAAQARAQATAKARAEFATCTKRLAPIVKALNDLKGREEIGLSESEYNKELGTLQGEMHEAPKVNEVGLRCGEAVLSVLRTNVDEIEASEVWSKCIENTACTPAEQKHQIQAKWSKADSDLQHAESQLAAVKEPEIAFDN